MKFYFQLTVVMLMALLSIRGFAAGFTQTNQQYSTASSGPVPAQTMLPDEQMQKLQQLIAQTQMQSSKLKAPAPNTSVVPQNQPQTSPLQPVISNVRPVQPVAMQPQPMNVVSTGISNPVTDLKTQQQPSRDFQQGQLGQSNIAAQSVPSQNTAQQAQTVVSNEQEVGNAANGGGQSDMYEEAFDKVVNQLFPMSPSQIARLKEAFSDAQRSASAPPGIPPKPTSSDVLVDLAPQATPPVIRLQAGYITSMVFQDSTGQPWPIAAYSLGDPSAFNIQWDRKGNTLLVQAVTFYKRTNLAVILRGLNTPVMITLLPGQEAVDYRVDLRVPGLGPNAVVSQNGLPGGANPILVDVLNGIPPRGSKALKVSGGDCQAWFVNKNLYLRTTLDVISPAWKSIMTSIDGMHAYELQPAPVVLVLEHGKDKTLTLTLEGWE